MTKIPPFQASKFKKLLRQMILTELEEFRVHKLVGVVDYVWSSGTKYFADVFLNGFSPKFQDAFSSFSNWTVGSAVDFYCVDSVMACKNKKKNFLTDFGSIC